MIRTVPRVTDVPLERDLIHQVDVTEIHRLMGLPSGHESDARVERLVADARAWIADNADPWLRLRFPVLGPAGSIEGVAVAASAGAAIDACIDADWRDGRPDRGYALDRVGAALVEHLALVAARRAAAELRPHGFALTTRVSPGCEGTSLDGQAHLFEQLTAGHPLLPGPLEVFSTGALQPRLSQLVLFHIATVGAPGTLPLEPACTCCTLAPCALRRRPAHADLSV